MKPTFSNLRKQSVVRSILSLACTALLLSAMIFASADVTARVPTDCNGACNDWGTCPEPGEHLCNILWCCEDPEADSCVVEDAFPVGCGSKYPV